MTEQERYHMAMQQEQMQYLSMQYSDESSGSEQGVTKHSIGIDGRRQRKKLPRGYAYCYMSKCQNVAT